MLSVESKATLKITHRLRYNTTMDIVKFPDKFTSADFTTYLIDKARELELCEDFPLRGLLTRAFGRVLQDVGDRYLLVAVIDHLLTGSFVKTVGVTERLVTFGTVDIAIREIGSERPWRYLTLARFVDTENEAEFFDYWLGVLDDVKSAPPGTLSAGGVPWVQRQVEAEEQLETAILELERRLKTRGYLTEFRREVAEPRLTPPETVEFLRNLRRGLVVKR